MANSISMKDLDGYSTYKQIFWIFT